MSKSPAEPRARAVTKETEFERYAGFAREVFQGNPYWRGGDDRHLIAEISNRTAYASHSRAQPFWVTEGDRVLAVVTGLVDEAFNQRWNQKTGHLVGFDARPDCEGAAVSVLGEACGWLRSQGAEFARFGLKFGWQLPLGIDAYDEAPTIFHSYNPPYYHRYLKNAGFFTEKGAVEFRVQFTEALANRYRKLAAAQGVALRQWNFARLEQENRLFSKLLDETFAKHWGCGPFTEEELAGLTIGFKDYLIPEFLWFAEVGGEPAGFVYSLPDLNQGARITHGVLLIIGVREKFRGRGVNTALAASSYLKMIERGYHSASYTVVLDDNWPSRRTAEKLGARVARNFAIYRRDWN